MVLKLEHIEKLTDTGSRCLGCFVRITLYQFGKALIMARSVYGLISPPLHLKWCNELNEAPRYSMLGWLLYGILTRACNKLLMNQISTYEAVLVRSPDVLRSVPKKNVLTLQVEAQYLWRDQSDGISLMFTSVVSEMRLLADQIRSCTVSPQTLMDNIYV